MAEFYSRVASASLKKETTANTAVTPTIYFGIVAEDMGAEYAYTPSMPVESNRVKNIRAVKNKIPAPKGSITVNLEPKIIGHFLTGLFGTLTDGQYFPFTGLTGTFVVGNTITGGSSAKTATVVYVGDGFLLCTGPTGLFTSGETISNGSGASATLTSSLPSVYGHAKTLPVNSLPTYSVQFNYANSAIRYFGLRFTGIDAIKPKDNILQAKVKCIAQSQFRHARITSITVSGAGSKVISVDQSSGLVAGDVIKLYRPSTDTFLDFASAGVKTHTIDSVNSETAIQFTNLQTSVAVDDLIMLAPQTASYSEGNEFSWIGGSTFGLGAAIASLATFGAEDFDFTIINEFEERHGAGSTYLKDRFPTKMLQKSCEIKGSFKAAYSSEINYRNLRLNTAQAVRLTAVGSIVSGLMYNTLRISFPAVQFDPYQTNIAEDAIVDEQIPFKAFYDSTTGTVAEVLLVNDVASY